MFRALIVIFCMLSGVPAALAYDMGAGMTVDVTAYVVSEGDVGYMDQQGRCYAGEPAPENEVACVEMVVQPDDLVIAQAIEINQ